MLTTVILKISKGSTHYYAFPTNQELFNIEIKFDQIVDNGFSLKSLLEAEYEQEIDNFNAIERTVYEYEMLEQLSFELSDEFTRLIEI